MSQPLVSVVIPTYNRAALVQTAIDSVFAQNYPRLEIIVVDDGSSDDTGAILATRYGQEIQYFWQENQGESVARNKGIAVAHGEYIALLDSDDQWLPEKIERQLEVMERSTGVVVSGCQVHTTDFNGRLIEDTGFYTDDQAENLTLERMLLANTFGGGSTALIRCHSLRQLGGFDPSIRFGEDWDLWLRMLINGGKFAMISEPLVLVRRHHNAQCHLPRPENLDRVLRDHLRLLHNAFDSLAPLSETLQVLHTRSIGRQYLEAAFAGFAWQKSIDAAQWLTKAFQLDPGIWSNGLHLSTLLVNYGAAITEIEDEFTPCRIDRYVNSLFDALNSHQRLSVSIRRKARAQLYADAGFRLFQAQEMDRARQYMTVALRSDPGLWRDLGLLRRWYASWK